MMKKRIQNIFKMMGKNAPDAMVFNYSSIRDYSFFYATGFIGGSFEGSSAVAFPDGKCSALIPQLEENIATTENSKNKLGLNVLVFKTGKEHIDFLKKELSGCKKIGIDYGAMSIATKNRIGIEAGIKCFTDISKVMRDGRAIKDGAEISRIKKACQISEKAYAQLLNEGALKKGVSENEIAARLGYLMQKNGGTQSFPTIVAFGKNGASPHHSTSDAKLKNGDLVLIDWGAKFERYCADLSRTFVFGRMTNKQEAMMETVKDAQEVGFNLMRSGVDASAVHGAVLDFIDKTQFAGTFVHSTGHTLGLQVHDGKTLGLEKFKMEPGMAFTVEPGVYVKGIGGVRIEDDVIVNRDGIEKLSKGRLFFEL